MDYFIMNPDNLIITENNLYWKHKRHYNTFNNRLQTYDLHVITILSVGNAKIDLRP